ncbi:histone deacetylase family protein [Rhizoctonia solani]|uniref:Histone deacetylase family protein n=1 Tax=Rhizoctonia solani TaxID=456999 RepID=A0A8H8NYM8_9AGAM|nr:histone deacetylase family protein [Rhizoctonia solani]QRW20462.1 histone deacetylase family protein [Rhizoctonia solani]
MDLPEPKLSIHIQPSCSEHRYIRDKDLSTIVEKPERLRALAVGIAAGVALNETAILPGVSTSSNSVTSQDELAIAMEKMSLQSSEDIALPTTVAKIIRYARPADASFLNNPAVRMVHALEEDIESSSGEEYLSQLSRWALESESRIKTEGSEIPKGEGLSQGDLYLCPRTLHAIAGALETTCKAVDSVIGSTSPRSFAAIRPPGHHCGSDEPAGFCWVNNILVGIAHAYRLHGITRAVIFDIDLHHGNGTQSITWKLNAETHRKRLEAEARFAAGISEAQPEGLQIYYGSLHDILSYPCEDGDPTLTAAASVSLHGNAHGQHIENVHLQEWKDEDDFFNRLYGNSSESEGEGYATRLFGRAKDFLKGTGAIPEKTMVFVSCGFDAGENEYESMSRHNRRVPTTFYHRFACDAREFAEVYAKGRVVGVLEGGYSDRALVSGGMAWINGMIGLRTQNARDLWKIPNLEKIELATGLKKTRKPRSSTSKTPAPSHEPWISRVLDLLPTLDGTFGASHLSAPRTKKKVDPLPSTRTLRDRAPKAQPELKEEKPASTKAKYAPVSSAKSLRAEATGIAPRPESPGDEFVPPVPPVLGPLSDSTKLSPDSNTATVPPVARETSTTGTEMGGTVRAFEGISLNSSETVNQGPESISDPSKASLVIKLKRPPPSTDV